MEKQQIQQLIQQKLNITAQQYNQLMYELGEDYFAIKCGEYKLILESFRSSRIMWSWWINQFYLMDEAIIHDEKDLTPELYRAIHIGMDYYPNDAIVKKATEEYSNAIKMELKHNINS